MATDKGRNVGDSHMSDMMENSIQGATYIDIGRVNEQEVRDICESLKYSIRNRRQTSPDEYDRIDRLYQKLMSVLPQPKIIIQKSERPVPEVKEIKPQSVDVKKLNKATKQLVKMTSDYQKKFGKDRNCARCSSKTTYVYQGSPRWHFIDGKTYCHKCYSRIRTK